MTAREIADIMDRPLPGIAIPQGTMGISDIGVARIGQAGGAAAAIE